MRLFPGHATDARSDNLQVLTDASPVPDKATTLIITENQAQSLVDKMNGVRDLGLGYVEFRGCTIGRDQKNLDTLKDFLGANRVGGPDELSTYAMVTPQIARDSAQFDRWLLQFGAQAVEQKTVGVDQKMVVRPRHARRGH
jgi:hypothetical protein